MLRKKSKPIEGWAAAIEAAMRDKEQRPSGEGWRTSHELREDLGVGRAKFYATLRVMREAGRLEHFSGLVLIDAKLSRCEWYRLR
ncbi:MAG: hypothetical protein FJY48_11730 [Betaproteobacteria bacterium]|nr:hypothetical protein [Betaproteobacteria bacterium]